MHQRVGAAIAAAGYRGGYGIDAWHWRDGAGDALQPLGELNARLSMGSWAACWPTGPSRPSGRRAGRRRWTRRPWCGWSRGRGEPGAGVGGRDGTFARIDHPREHGARRRHAPPTARPRSRQRPDGRGRRREITMSDTPAGIRLGRIGQVAQHVADIDRSVAFYRDALGLPLSFLWRRRRWRSSTAPAPGSCSAPKAATTRPARRRSRRRRS
ncbi:MAG: VOC family protein [Anaerolineae bacterium]